MIRGQEIAKAALNFNLPNGREDFYAGAIWADNHPKNPWHAVKDGDLPQVNKDYVFSYNGFSYIGYMREDKSLHFNDEYAPMLDIDEVDYWMEIPELPTV
ncbi:hypothetical protein [Prevotella histicola]|uniref:hypothetical protein n=1 Tax=Prevotella histicola TaxID=470565 RepID=UPI0028E64A8D|nr:hypothetical protein [Prevotella histicola]